MLVATQSFSAVYDGERIAVHRGTTRISEDHELARRFPHRFTPVKMREQARARFRGQLDQATTYEEYVRRLDDATGRLERTVRGGVVRAGGQSVTDHFYR
jgi:hypothetical protein